MHDETTAKMSATTAEVLFGPGGYLGVAPSDFDRDLYELRKLADQVLGAMAAKEAQEMAFRGAKEDLPYARPELEFTIPMPSWDEI